MSSSNLKSVAGSTLKPAAELARASGVRFPNESAEYRRAREALLAEEIELRRHIERVAEQRRALPPGGDDAAFNVFTRRGGTIRHFWGGEMNGASADPGQDPRGAPDLMPLWTILDVTPQGRGTDWYPKLNY